VAAPLVALPQGVHGVTREELDQLAAEYVLGVIEGRDAA
jgi:hypothetical protein